MTTLKFSRGDSSVKLPEILDEISNGSILFWLDGHYSGENTAVGEKQCSVYEELDAIFNHGITSKYILIDDARCFNGTNDYPSIKELTEFVKNKEQGLKVEIINDIIHIY